MCETQVKGTFYKDRGRGHRPVVFIDPPADEELDDWQNEHNVTTIKNIGRHPRNGEQVPQLYPSPKLLSQFNDGDLVTVKLAIRTRTDKPGNGLRTPGVARRSG